MAGLEFNKITIEDNERYRGYLKKCPVIPADVYPGMIWGYEAVTPQKRAYADDLCWQTFEKDGKCYWYPPVGDWSKADWVELFAKYVPEGTCFRYVPKELKDMWEATFPGKLEISTNRDEWDYIYELDVFIGNTQKQRRMADFFEKNYVFSLEEMNESNIPEIKAFADKTLAMLIGKNEDNYQELIDDSQAQVRMMDDANKLEGLNGLAIRIDGELKAYSIWEELDNRVVGLFNRNDYSFKGIHENIMKEMAILVEKNGGEIVNYMCDAGIQSIRQNKIERKPQKLLEKYTISIKKM